MRNKIKTGHRKEDGQSIVELAIGIPFLMMIIIGVIEMGLVFATYVSLINATPRRGYLCFDSSGTVDRDTG